MLPLVARGRGRERAETEARQYEPEFKARAVRLVRDHMDDYGSVTAASVAVGARPGVTTAEVQEIRRLKVENMRLADADAILRVASTLFAGELDSRNR